MSDFQSSYLRTVVLNNVGNSELLLSLGVGLLLALMMLASSKSVSQEYRELSISQKEIAQSIADTIKVLEEVYVYPEKVGGLERELNVLVDNKAYADIVTKKQFVSRLSDDLKRISGDAHLSIALVKDKTNVLDHRRVETIDNRKFNFSFEKLEVLKGNIAYLKFNKFYDAEGAKSVLGYAFGFLKRSDAIIIDLRDNVGGSPDLVQFMLSFFLEPKVHLWSTYGANGVKISSAYSMDKVPGGRFKANIPLYLITSDKTASAAELFSYTLKHLGKAKTVGKNTRGAAHLVSMNAINASFNGRFSVQRPYNPITQTDWEGVGVLSNIDVSLDDAIEVARLDALKNLSKTK